MRVQPASTSTVAAAEVGKVENLPTVLTVDGVQGKAVTKEFNGRLTKIYRQRK
jgi:hypothetical protein